MRSRECGGEEQGVDGVHCREEWSAGGWKMGVWMQRAGSVDEEGRAGSVNGQRWSVNGEGEV